jgi:class 3 adenylate cyclase/tetratricopeptide (TPR) repeat protein
VAAIQRIADWLEKLGMSEYAERFTENRIDFSVLPDLTDQDLKDLGVVLGDRRKMLRAISDLTQGPAVAPQTPAARASKPQEAERRQLTVMFCDLVGSTALSARLDPEELRDIITAYHRRCTELIERNGGFVAKYMGDGVLAYFGYPHAHEDDAERAVRAGLALADAAPKLNTVAGVALQVRVGVATGLVVVGDLIGSGSAQEQAVVGDTPNLAARLQAMATPGSVVLAESTRRLTGRLFEYRDLGSVSLKGFSDNVAVWQALGEGAAEGRFEALRGSTTPLVGRDEEIELLLRRWEEAKGAEGSIVLVSGEPGIGKSRLAQTLLERLSGQPHTRLRYFCSPHHQNSALYPSIAQLERAAGFRREDTAEQKLAKLEAVLSLGTNELSEVVPLFADLLAIPTGERYPPVTLSPQKKKDKTLHAQIAQVERLAAREPVLMLFEDIHWSDPTTRESLDLLIERVPALRILVILTFRPEFNPSWIGRPQVSLLSLNRLPPRRRSEMIAYVAGGALPKEIADQIVERTDGVPLFIEELTKTVIESGMVAENAGAYAATGPVAPLAIPATLQGSLLARLDRLAPTREIAQIAAALGRQFSHELISAAAHMPQPQVDDALAQLVAAELMFRRGVPPDAEYTFKHALVQDAAYSTLLRSQRHLIHDRIVAALESQFPEVVEGQPEKLAFHCAEAGEVEKAVSYYLAASRQAFARSAMHEVDAHARKGIDLLERLADVPTCRQRELELRIVLGNALQTTRGITAEETGQAYQRAWEICAEIGRPPELVSVIWGLWEFRSLRQELDLAEQFAAQMRQLGQAENNSTFIFFSCHMSGLNHAFLGDFSRSRAYFEEGLRNQPAVIAATHPRVGSLMNLARMLLYLGHLDQARERYKEGLALARKSNPFSLAIALSLALPWLSVPRLYDDFMVVADEQIALCHEQGFKWFGVLAAIRRGWCLAMKGRAEEGVAEIMNAWPTVGPVWPDSLLQLADSLGKAGQPEEGLKRVAEAEQTKKQNGEIQVRMHGVRARLLLALGESHAAEESLQRGLAVARSQQARFLELLTAMELAQLWHGQGKVAQARELVGPIFGWFTEGLDMPVLQDAKALLDKLA